MSTVHQESAHYARIMLTIKSEVPLIIPNPGYSFIQAIRPRASTLRHYAGTEVFFTDGVFAALARMPRLESVEMLESSWDAEYAVPLLTLGTLHHIASIPATFCALKFAHVIGTAEVVDQMLACFHAPLTRAHIHLSEVQAPEELENIMRSLSYFAWTLTSVSIVDATNPDWSSETPSFDYNANILRFLLPCRSLRTFEFDIETLRQLDVRDVYLEQVVRSWPLLEEFTLLWGGRDLHYVDHHRVRLPSDLTVHSLTLFSTYCRHLRKLQIVWLYSKPPTIPGPLPVTIRHTAGKLFFRIYFEPKWNPQAFAAFLDSLWPDLPIDFDRGSYFCETHRIIETVDRSVRALYELRA